MKKKNDNYFSERNSDITEKLRCELTALPAFCRDYFVATEMTTSPLTRLNYARDLAIFFDYAVNTIAEYDGKIVGSLSCDDLNVITASDISYFLSFLTEYDYRGRHYTNTENGKARKLSALRAMFKYLYKNDLIKQDITAKVAHPKIHEKEIIRLDGEEIVDILSVIKSFDSLYSEHQNKYNVHTKCRDLAIITLLLGTGIRVSECVGLNVADIDFDNNAFVVTRKGGNRSTLYFSDEIKTVLYDYIDFRGKNDDTDALFLSLQGKRISVRAVEVLVKKFARIISPLKHITPHKLRSTYGTNLYRATKDIYVVAEVLGHKDINTTKKHYAAIDEDIKRNAATKVVLNPKPNTSPKNGKNNT